MFPRCCCVALFIFNFRPRCRFFRHFSHGAVRVRSDMWALMKLRWLREEWSRKSFKIFLNCVFLKYHELFQVLGTRGYRDRSSYCLNQWPPNFLKLEPILDCARHFCCQSSTEKPIMKTLLFVPFYWYRIFEKALLIEWSSYCILMLLINRLHMEV